MGNGMSFEAKNRKKTMLEGEIERLFKAGGIDKGEQMELLELKERDLESCEKVLMGFRTQHDRDLEKLKSEIKTLLYHETFNRQSEFEKYCSNKVLNAMQLNDLLTLKKDLQKASQNRENERLKAEQEAIKKDLQATTQNKEDKPLKTEQEATKKDLQKANQNKENETPKNEQLEGLKPITQEGFTGGIFLKF